MNISTVGMTTWHICAHWKLVFKLKICIENYLFVIKIQRELFFFFLSIFPSFGCVRRRGAAERNNDDSNVSLCSRILAIPLRMSAQWCVVTIYKLVGKKLWAIVGNWGTFSHHQKCELLQRGCNLSSFVYFLLI